MDPSEILHRVRALAWMMCRRNVAPSAVHVQPVKPWDVARPPISDPARLRLLEEADGYLDHRWFFFGLGGVEEPEIDWQLDPASGKSTPRIFSPRIDFRNPLDVGSIKHIWEKNRHYHLTVLSATRWRRRIRFSSGSATTRFQPAQIGFHRWNAACVLSRGCGASACFARHPTMKACSGQRVLSGNPFTSIKPLSIMHSRADRRPTTM